MTDTKMMQERITGLQSRIENLKAKERAFTKFTVLAGEIEKAAGDLMRIEAEIASAKSIVAALEQKRRAALQQTGDKIAAKLASVLPEGEPYIDLEDKVRIGWRRPSGPVLFPAMSGGEKVIFGTALADALIPDGEKLIIIEAGEVDDGNLRKMLATLTEKNPDAQIVCNSWHVPEIVPDGWSVFEVGGEKK